MIILLYGEDTYRSKKKMEEIIKRYKEVHKSGMNLVYCEDIISFKGLEKEVCQPSIFKEKRLYVIFNPLSRKELKEEITKNVNNLENSDDIFIIIEEGKIRENDIFLKSISSKAKAQEFKLLSGIKLQEWIKKEINKYNKEIDFDALELLINNKGNDLWAISNEVMKLINFSKRGKISKKDVSDLTRPGIENDIFKTIDSIADKNRKKSFELIHRHFEKGDSPLYILSMISFQFKNILIIKDLIEKGKKYNEILSLTKIHPFVVRKSFAQAEKFSLLELKKIYRKILSVDINVKTGITDQETALELFIAGISDN